jgi:hypothetical protein
MEIADVMLKVRKSTRARLNKEKKKYDRKASHDQVINDALDFKKKYKKVVL